VRRVDASRHLFHFLIPPDSQLCRYQTTRIVDEEVEKDTQEEEVFSSIEQVEQVEQVVR